MSSITIPKYLFYSLMIGILLISAIFFFAMKDGNSCISNPMIYGAKKATNDDTGSLQCSCSFSNLKYAPFYFNEKEMGSGSLLAP